MLSFCIWFGTGVVLALTYVRTVLPDQAGEAPAIQPTVYPIMFKGMLIVPVTRSTAVHVHHWMVYTALLVFCSGILGPLGSGFALTLAIHGFTKYSDRLQLTEKNPWMMEPAFEQSVQLKSNRSLGLRRI